MQCLELVSNVVNLGSIENDDEPSGCDCLGEFFGNQTENRQEMEGPVPGNTCYIVNDQSICIVSDSDEGLFSVKTRTPQNASTYEICMKKYTSSENHSLVFPEDETESDSEEAPATQNGSQLFNQSHLFDETIHHWASTEFSFPQQTQKQFRFDPPSSTLFGQLDETSVASFRVLFGQEERSDVPHRALMPTVPGDDQQIIKKRNVGNDHVHIVWCENGRGYDTETISSQFNNAHIIIHPLESNLFMGTMSGKSPHYKFGPLLEGSVIVDAKPLGFLVRYLALFASHTKYELFKTSVKDLR